MKSRRSAREASLRVLYELEFGNSDIDETFDRTVADMELSEEMSQYAQKVVAGIIDMKSNLDQNIAGYVRDYDYSRLAAIDRNILRVAAYELLFIPEIPPAVSINEAIEISKKYSTAESGKFINGVLGRVLKDSDKVNWDPKKAPSEERIVVESVVVQEETVEEGSEDAKIAQRFGQWTIKSSD
ncbi:hypothetical protein BH11ARM1_BH11ARM1_03970 [soil metagenome]